MGTASLATVLVLLTYDSGEVQYAGIYMYTQLSPVSSHGRNLYFVHIEERKISDYVGNIIYRCTGLVTHNAKYAFALHLVLVYVYVCT